MKKIIYITPLIEWVRIKSAFPLTRTIRRPVAETAHFCFPT